MIRYAYPRGEDETLIGYLADTCGSLDGLDVAMENNRSDDIYNMDIGGGDHLVDIAISFSHLMKKKWVLYHLPHLLHHVNHLLLQLSLHLLSRLLPHPLKTKWNL
jgi:hypothetical protein